MEDLAQSSLPPRGRSTPPRQKPPRWEFTILSSSRTLLPPFPFRFPGFADAVVYHTPPSVLLLLTTLAGLDVTGRWHLLLSFICFLQEPPGAASLFCLALSFTSDLFHHLYAILEAQEPEVYLEPESVRKGWLCHD